MLSKRFLKFCMIGFIGGVVEILLLLVFEKILSFHYILSNFLAFFISISFLFYFNNNYVFGNFKTKISKKRFAVFLLSRSFGLLIDLIILFILVDILKCNLLFSKIISISVAGILNYYIGKKKIFV